MHCVDIDLVFRYIKIRDDRRSATIAITLQDDGIRTRSKMQKRCLRFIVSVPLQLYCNDVISSAPKNGTAICSTDLTEFIITFPPEESLICFHAS